MIAGSGFSIGAHNLMYCRLEGAFWEAGLRFPSGSLGKQEVMFNSFQQ
jgi:hypothetical protein